MKKFKKIIISIFLTLLIMCGSLISVSADYANTYVGINMEDMYLYRCDTLYQPISTERYWYSIYTQFEKGSSWVTDVTDMSYQEYVKLGADFFVDEDPMTVGSWHGSVSWLLSVLLVYFGCDVIVKNNSYGFTGSNIIKQHSSSDIAFFWEAGYYSYISSAINPNESYFNDFIEDLNNGTEYGKSYYSINWLKFIRNMAFAFSYAVNNAEGDSDYTSPCVSVSMSPDMKNMFCYSLYNIMYYEYGMTDLSYSNVTNLFDTVFNKFGADNIPGGMHADDAYFEMYLIKNQINIPGVNGIGTHEFYSLSDTSNYLSNDRSYRTIVSRGYNYLVGINIFGWLPTPLQVALYGIMFSNLALVSFFFIKKILPSFIGGD